MNEISSGLNDAANSSPLGSWTGTPIATADVIAYNVSTASRSETTDLQMDATNQDTEIADQSTAIELCFNYETRPLNPSAAGKLVRQPGAVFMLLIFLVIVAASTASNHWSIQDCMSEMPQYSTLIPVVVHSAHILFTAANYSSQFISDTGVPPDVTDYYQTYQSATSSLEYVLHNHGRSEVTANSGKLPCTEVQLKCWAHMHHLLWAHIHQHWLKTEPQSQSGLTEAAKVHLPDLHTILSNRMHASYKAKVTPAMEYIPGQQNTPQVPALCQPPYHIHRTTFTEATAFSEKGSSPLSTVHHRAEGVHLRSEAAVLHLVSRAAAVWTHPYQRWQVKYTVVEARAGSRLAHTDGGSASHTT